MKILHVVPSLMPASGGPSRSVPELCRALAEEGTEVTLFSTHVPGGQITIDPERVPYEVTLFPAKDGSLAGARQINRAIQKRAGDFDLIHIHSLWNFTVTWAAAAARKAKIPYIIAPRGMLSEACLRQRRYALKRAYAGAFDRGTVEGAARLHFLNDDERRASQHPWLRNPEHFLARNGIELKPESVRRGFLRALLPELEGRRVMLFLGRLHSIKGLDLQLQALQCLIPKHPDLIWLLAGPDDGEWQRLDSLIKKLGLESHAKWVGPVASVDRFSALAEADVVVQTSFYECQSMTVNEAMAVGTPLVVTNSINYGEVQSAGAGIVVSRNADAVAIAVDAILQAPDAGAEMRKAGRRFATGELSWRKIAAIVNHAYNDAVEGLSGRDNRHKARREAQLGASA